MKVKLIFAFPFLIVVVLLFVATVPSFGFRSLQQNPMDTVTYYLVWKEHYQSNNKDVYKVDGHVVSKKTYDKYPYDATTVNACRPCFAKVYGKDGHIKYEGDMYTDCPVGFWTEYYPSGKPKVIGSFLRDSTGRYDTTQTAKWCSIRHGEWKYYNEAGRLDSAVNYLNGLRVQ